MEKPSFWLSKRYLVAFILFLNFLNFQILRNNINIAVVEITSQQSNVEGNETVSKSPDFNWDSNTIGIILSIAAYGGLLSFLGGFVVNFFGGAVTGTLCLFVAGALTLLHPIALYTDFRLFLVCRFVVGAFESIFYASSGDISVRWFPEKERPTLISLSCNGLNVGTAVVYPICGYVAYTWGWEMVFYVTGVFSMTTSALSLIFIRNRPSQDKFITKKELQYILEGTSDAEINGNHPYKKILTSKPIWCLSVISFAYMWISSILGSCLPLYIKDLTRKNTDEIGLISSIPNIAFIFAVPLAGNLVNYWQTHSTFTITRIHKISMIFACVSATISLAVVVIIPDFITSMVLFVSMEVETAFMIAIIIMIPVYMYPSSASFINGLVLVFFSVGAIVSQSVTMAMVPNHTRQEWNNCFFLTSIILLVSGLIFVSYGSSEPQSWSSEQTRRQSVTLEEISAERKRSIISESRTDMIRRLSWTPHTMLAVNIPN